MSAENVEIVRGVYRGWSQGDLGAGLPFYDPEMTFESFNYGDATERFVGHGPEAVQRLVAEFLTDLSNYRLIAEEVIALDADHVFVNGYHTATGRQSGVPVRDPAFTLWRFRDGRVVALIIGRDRAQVLAAAGLSE